MFGCSGGHSSSLQRWGIGWSGVPRHKSFTSTSLVNSKRRYATSLQQHSVLVLFLSSSSSFFHIYLTVFEQVFIIHFEHLLTWDLSFNFMSYCYGSCRKLIMLSLLLDCLLFLLSWLCWAVGDNMMSFWGLQLWLTATTFDVLLGFT